MGPQAAFNETPSGTESMTVAPCGEDDFLLRQKAKRTLEDNACIDGSSLFVGKLFDCVPPDAVSVSLATSLTCPQSIGIREAIGHTLAPIEQGATVQVRGDGWGN